MDTKTRISTVATYARLGAAAAGSFALLRTLTTSVAIGYPTPPDRLVLSGVVRDFRKTHADFDLGTTTGHVVGTVDDDLDADRRPVYTGNGFVVTQQWQDDSGQAIPSHLYSDAATPRLAVSTSFRLQGTCAVDSFDSTLGPYGGANVGNDAVLGVDTTAANAVQLETGTWINGDVLIGQGGDPGTVVDRPSQVTGTITALPQPLEMPVITAPTDVGPYLGPQSFVNAGTVTISSNRNWGHTYMEGSRFVFDGEITILVESLDIDMTASDFIFNPGASLKLYVNDWCEIDDDASINMNTGEPSRLTIYMLGVYDGSGDEEETGLLDIEDRSGVTCNVVAPFGKMLIDNDCDFFGTFVGASIELTGASRLHVDRATFSTGCATGDGAAGAVGAASDGEVSSAATFAQWFDDDLGTNLSMKHVITLEQDAFGVYEHVDGDFHPIDGRLFGNEGDAHNEFFTYVIDASFVHSACAGKFFEFQGGDGAWLFIDGRIVMDLGGVATGSTQYVDIDRLGLTDGETYAFLFLYASRNDAAVDFRMRTNLELVTDSSSVTVSAGYD